ncbi:DNA-directed RNA polymerase subunit A' [Candidatus Micrarchaeota archaeon]|nr:DNA-directed RNA polymerase subunit A' [Candidatus Micrarchaeota archaeon]
MTDSQVQKMVDKIKFTIFSPEMVRKMAAAKIFVPDTYDDDGYPIEGGLVDVKLGVVDPGLRCKTCGGKVRECPGHFGFIEMVRPVTHVSFTKQILHALKNTCPNCHRYVSKTAGYIAKSKKEEPEFEVAPEAEGAETVQEGKSKPSRKRKCPHCNAHMPVMKLLKPTTLYKDNLVMLPSEIREWLAAIPDEDLLKLGFDPVYSRPEWMVLNVLLVPPVSARPSITLETGERSEDDLTHKLVDIIRINQKLEANINAGAPQLIIEDLWELLQYHVTTFFDNETANIPPARHRSGRPLKTLAQRLKGKEGRFRYNLSGKRVNFSARTVVSPDPRINMDEVGVPEAIAGELTVPIAITEWNVDYCKKLILSDTSPKALYVIRTDGRKIKVNELTREEISKDLKIGWTLERQISDGDIVLFNRQPSLHRISMMGHTVKVLPGRTFRVNPIVIAPYNADFDGDEMNLHAMQTQESQAEAKFLTKVDGQILSPRHGHAIIKPQEDHISGLYFLTHDKTTFTTEEAANLMYLLGIEEMPKQEKKGIYSGKTVFSMILPKDFSFKSKSKIKGTVAVEKGQLIKGTLDSKTSTEIIEKIFLQYGQVVCREFIDRMTKLSLETLSMMGLSVSLKDYTLSENAQKDVEAANKKMQREVDNLIVQFKNKTLERAPGMTLKETLESMIMQVTSKTRNDVGAIVNDALGSDNPSIIMANIGSRGSLLNAVQMSAVVAQQAVRNKRPSRGYNKRALLFFEKNALGAKERGYVFNGFRKGLEPYEFFLHAMGGRESLVNTAIRTARSGYMQRRLINALQDLIVYPDNTVRDAGMGVVQFIYGADGMDPMLATKTEIIDVAKQDDVDTA